MTLSIPEAAPWVVEVVRVQEMVRAQEVVPEVGSDLVDQVLEAVVPSDLVSHNTTSSIQTTSLTNRIQSRVTNGLSPGLSILKITSTIIEGCKNQDRRSQYLLYKEVYGYLKNLSLIYYSSNDDISESINAVFLKVVMKIDTLKDPVAFPAWLKRIAINTIIDQLKAKNKLSRFTVLSDDTAANSYDAGLMAFNQAEDDIENEHLRAWLKEIPTTSRLVFMMKALEGYSHKEISDQLHITPGSSRWHLSFAKSELAKKFKAFATKLKTLVL